MAMDPRLEQFRKMAEADPTNEVGHFSLGKAYLDSGMNAEAIVSLRRVIELNPNISKVYQMIAQALLAQGKRDEAVGTLTKGVEIAQTRGEPMPKRDMIAKLKELGAPVPVTDEGPAGAMPAVGEGQVQCSRCGQIKPKMAKPPYSKPIGKEIQDRVCADCWREWIGMGTKVINELRLPMTDPAAQKMFDQHMREFLGW